MHTAPSAIYTLSLHDALPIYDGSRAPLLVAQGDAAQLQPTQRAVRPGCAIFDLPVLTAVNRFQHRRAARTVFRSEEHTSELQSLRHLVCRLLLEKKNKKKTST